MLNLQHSQHSVRGHIYFISTFVFFLELTSLEVLRPSKCLKKQLQPNLGKRVNTSLSHHLPKSTNIVFDTLYS